MGWSKKKPDPISDRARALNDQIASLEAQIKQLDTKLGQRQPGPRLRSTARPHGAAVPSAGQPAPPPPAAPVVSEPIFEEVDQNRLRNAHESVSPPEHFNDLGVRKYDLTALWRRIKNHFRGPATDNPKLVSYLAAGSIQGLRPMRYEKRVARNRVLFLFIVVLGFLVGIFAVVFKKIF
jgi:hypothetical protein